MRDVGVVDMRSELDTRVLVIFELRKNREVVSFDRMVERMASETHSFTSLGSLYRFRLPRSTVFQSIPIESDSNVI